MKDDGIGLIVASIVIVCLLAIIWSGLNSLKERNPDDND